MKTTPSLYRNYKMEPNILWICIWISKIDTLRFFQVFTHWYVCIQCTRAKASCSLNFFNPGLSSLAHCFHTQVKVAVLNAISLNYNFFEVLLKYGFHKKYSRKNEPLTSWTLFSPVFFQISADQCWSGKKRGKKVFNWSEVHFLGSTSYEIHSLDTIAILIWYFSLVFSKAWKIEFSVNRRRPNSACPYVSYIVSWMSS